MIGMAQGKHASLSQRQEVTRDSGNLLARKIWLPKILYEALPYFYVAAGFAAFFATIYISDWFWVLPHYLLFSIACVHLGLLIYRRRRRALQGDA